LAHIYIITNLINSSVYIGKTTNLKDRLYRHSRGLSGCPRLHNSVKKYGWNNFSVDVHDLGDCTQEELNDYEIRIIAEYKEAGIDLMNLTAGGDGQCGWKPTEETRKKISSSLKGKQHSYETRLRMAAAHTRERSAMTGKTGASHPTAKPIILIHPSGVEEYFNCAIDAVRKYNLNSGNISNVARGRLQHYKGFRVRYVEKI